MIELPKLEYEYNALEPHIDEETMKIHHSKHHQAYTDKFNQAIEKLNLLLPGFSFLALLIISTSIF